MSIVIKTEKVVERGVAKRMILEINALGREELPVEYLRGTPCCYRNTNYNQSPVLCGTNEQINPILTVNHTVREEEFQSKYLPWIKGSGARLREINDRIRELEKAWKGEETFII